MAHKKLDNRQEKNVVLSHLCNVSPEYIRSRWNVAPSTVTKLILGQRSYGWNDPIVEFYRDVAEKENKDKNAMHLYLTFNGKAEGLTNADLLRPGEPHGVSGEVYKAVEVDVFNPKIVRLISQDTSLVSILTPRELGAEEKLINAIFGRMSDGYTGAERVVKPLLYEELRKAYDSKDSTITHVFDNVKFSILDTLRRGFNAMQDKEFRAFIDSKSLGRVQSLKEKMEEVLSTLQYREREIIKLRCGIGDGHTYTLEQVGRKFKITRERVRSIEAKALRQLQHPVRSKRLLGFLEDKPTE